jgi:hypothetical protein
VTKFMLLFTHELEITYYCDDKNTDKNCVKVQLACWRRKRHFVLTMRKAGPIKKNEFKRKDRWIP